MTKTNLTSVPRIPNGNRDVDANARDIARPRGGTLGKMYRSDREKHKNRTTADCDEDRWKDADYKTGVTAMKAKIRDGTWGSYVENHYNEARADLAEEALAAFMANQGLSDAEIETAVRDLLADLIHYCDRVGIDWPDILQRVHERYKEDTDVNDPPWGGPKARRRYTRNID